MARARGFASCIALPVKKLDKIVAIFILAAAEPDLFSEKEIALLEEATGDISFKLDVLEREKHRLEAEARLRHSELRLKQAQAIAHLGSWEVDFQTGKAIWSEESLRIYGLPPDEYEQSYEVWVSFIHPEDMDYVMRVSNEAVRTKTPGILYHRILRKDGTVRYLHSESHFVFDEAGNPTGLYGIAHDITDLKATEKALRESELRYSTIFHSSPQPKWIYDPESFRFVQVNRAAVERYGYSEEEFCNMTIFDIRPKEDYERVIKHMNKDVRALAGSRDSQFRHYTKSGEEIEVEIHSSSLVLNAKPYKLVVAIDVTAINRHQDRITSAIIQAQENERYEIGSELHDNVCQVLATSRLNLFALQPSIPAGILAPYKQASDHIAQAIREVRNLSHRLAPASFSDSTLEEAVKLLISSYSSFSGLHIELHVSPAIHDYDMSHGMKLNLYRIIQEQLNNIVKHAAATRACIELALISGHLLLLITDNGKGFDPSAIKGGIGMANMKRRAELFRGTLKIVSAPGQGTKLTLSVPSHNGPYRPAPATATLEKR
jgi:PAS domain S-box-containing protein